MAGGEPRWLIGGDAVMTIAADAPTVWLVDIDDPSVLTRADAIASLPNEAAEFAHRGDAGERLIRRRLARSMLAAGAGCRADEVAILRDERGAPVVATPAGWYLAVAARWPICAIGVAPIPLGVDVEAAAEPLPADLLTQAERQSAEPASERCWALKEAHAKWTGRPLDLDPSTIDTATAGRVTSPLGTTRSWSREWNDHVAAVCIA